MAHTRVLLDTDIGSDIDDSVCLAYLLMQPECELLGISTVSGEPDVRARIASALCVRAGMSTPIAVGTALPFLIDPRQPVAQQGATLDRWPHHDADYPGHGVDLLRATIRKHPGEVVLLAIGPLTNVAQLCLIDPEAVAMLKGLVTMGGDFSAGTHEAEWNMLLDPHAAAIVYRASIPSVRSVGQELTKRVAIDEGAVQAQFAAPILAPILDYAPLWFEVEPLLTFHDPVAAAMIFNDSICTFERGTVDVETCGADAGVTRFSPDPAGRHEIAVDIHPPAFFDEFSRAMER